MKWIAPCLTLLTCLAQAEEKQQALWIWHRRSPLTEAETQQLHASRIQRLYWHIGTVNIGKTALQWQAAAAPRFQSTAGLIIVPVIRGSFADGVVPQNTDPLFRLLHEIAQQSGANIVQLDFDCPDRLLAEYGAMLNQLRQRLHPTKLSITALAGCVTSPHFTALQASVDELQPMFYDLEPDLPADVLQHQAHPICEPSLVLPLLKAWTEKCHTPWWAGLPLYHRVTLFDAAGASRGHLRKWDWQSLASLPSLKWTPDTAMRWAEVTKEAKIGDAALHAGDQLIVRALDVAALHQLQAAVSTTTATGINWFRLPEAGLTSGVSMAQALAITLEQQPQPKISLKLSDERLVLTVADADLFPRLPQPDGSGLWRLEIRSEDGAVFREAGKGQFVHSAPMGGGTVHLADVLAWDFSALQAGEDLRSGLIRLAPGSDPDRLRWHLSPLHGDEDWWPLSPTHSNPF